MQQEVRQAVEEERDGPEAVCRCRVLAPLEIPVLQILIPQARGLHAEVVSLDLPAKVLLQKEDGVFDEEHAECADLVVGDVLQSTLALVRPGRAEIFSAYQFHGLQNRKQCLKAPDNLHRVLGL